MGIIGIVIIRPGNRKPMVVIIGIYECGKNELPFIVEAGSSSGSFFGARQCRQKQGSQNRDYRNDNQKLNQRKTVLQTRLKIAIHRLTALFPGMSDPQGTVLCYIFFAPIQAGMFRNDWIRKRESRAGLNPFIRFFLV